MVLGASLWAHLSLALPALGGVSPSPSEPARVDPEPARVDPEPARVGPEAARVDPEPGFGPGPYVQVGVGSATATGGIFQLGLATRIGGGWLYAPRDGSMLRVGVGARGSHFGAFGRDGSGLAAGEAHVVLGLGTPRWLPALRVGLGPAVIYGTFYDPPSVTGVGTLAAGLDGRLRERLAVGFEVGAVVDVIHLVPVFYGTLGVTWYWQLRPTARRRR